MTRSVNPRALSIIVACSLSGAVSAAPLCPAEPDFWLPWPAPAAGQLDVAAAEVDLSDPQVAILRGDVVIRDAEQELSAGEVRYRRDIQRVETEDAVRYRTPELHLEAASARIDLDDDRGELADVTYRLKDGGRGRAATVLLQDAEHTAMDAVSYTTCPLGQPDWVLRARSMTLDHESGRGVARGVALRFKDVPLFYLPYASFPIDDRRKSGFLYPGLGSSGDNGVDLQVPYYWNIAPNQDATITPRLISDRGAMLGLEYRYLLPRHYGEFTGEYLPDDDDTGTHRAFVQYRHIGRPSERLRLNVDFNHVSDEDYFEDFGDSLTATSRSFLRSFAELEAHGDWWRASLMADAYETVDEDITEEREPYNRLPRLLFTGLKPLGEHLEFGLDAEAVTFDRDVGIEGTRVDVYPRLQAPIYRPAFYLTPSIGVRHTAYNLDRDSNDSPSRTTPIGSLEGGLFFERSLANGGVQTLEPRFHYLYVPFESQSDLPEFDTREVTFGFGQLFRTNRYTGADRQTDANQIGLALSTRLYDPTGRRQVLDASIGTIVYFRDQKVQLSGEPVTADDTSPLVAEMHYRPSDFWRYSLGIQFDPEDDEFDQTVVSMQHRIPGGRILNLAYRRRTDLVRQIDASFLYPVSDRWTLIGRANYSLLDDENLETLLGFQYESCCWALRSFARRYIRNQEGDQRTGIYLELELKGLASLGRRTGRLLERAILGYRSEAY